MWEKAQELKVIAAEPSDLGSIPSSHERQPNPLSCPPASTYTPWHMQPPLPCHIREKIDNRQELSITWPSAVFFLPSVSGLLINVVNLQGLRGVAHICRLKPTNS